MPQIRGCDNTVVRPAEVSARMISDGDFVEAVNSFWPHAWGCATIFLIAGGWHLKQRGGNRFLALASAGLWIALWMLQFGRSLVEQSSRELLEMVWQLTPLAVLPSLWAAAAMRCRDWITAWARITTAIAGCALLWLYAIYAFAQQAYYGLVLSCVSLAWLASSPWIIRNHWAWNSDFRPPRGWKFRFQLRHLLTLMAVIALLYAYYRYPPIWLGIE
jgi:hypothetical protein